MVADGKELFDAPDEAMLFLEWASEIVNAPTQPTFKIS
jgi:hypothetical protein